MLRVSSIDTHWHSMKKDKIGVPLLQLLDGNLDLVKMQEGPRLCFFENLAVFGSCFKLANVQFITLVKYVNECKSALTVKQAAKSLMGIIADVHLAFGFNV